MKTAVLSAGASSSYSIYYDANGGTGDMEPTVEVYDGTNEVTLSQNTFTKEGYKFIGWDTDSAGATVVYEDGASFVMPNTDTTVYAVWEELPEVKATVNGYNDTYDGNAHGLTVTVTEPTSGATVMYGTEEGTYDLTECPTITNVADSPKTIYYKITADGYKGITGNATVIIGKANGTVSKAPEAQTLTYNGQAQELVTDGEATGGTLYYAVTTENEAPTDENLYTTSIPSATEAGTYYVWYKVKGDNNHNDSTAKLIEVTISKAPLTVSADTKSKIYGEMDPELTYQVDGLKGSDTSDVVTGELMREAGNSVGTYKILQKADTKFQADNYEITYQDADFTITPRLLNFKWNYKNPFIYDGQTKSIAAEILNRVGDDDVTLGYTGNTGIAAMKYIAVINLLKGIVAGNYQLSIDESDRSQEWEIQKADNTVTVNITGWTYGKYSEETNEPFVTGVTFGADTVQYTYYMDADCQTKTNTANSGAAAEGSVPVNAGTYYVQAVIPGTEDYNEVKAVESFVITPADITIQAEDKEGAYDTEIKTLTYQVTGDYATPVGEETSRTPKTGDALPKYTFWMMLASAGICIVAGSAKRRKKE